MPEIRSALAAVSRAGRFGATGGTGGGSGGPGLTVKEVVGRDLVQLSGWPDSFSDTADKLGGEIDCPLPESYRDIARKGDKALLKVAPERFWLLAPMAGNLGERLAKAFPSSEAVVTGLGHSRTVLRLGGPAVREVLAKGLPIDLHDSVFPVGCFAQSAIAHISVLVLRLDDAGGHPVFELFVPRGFAVNFWEWLVEAAAERGAEVLPPVAA